MTAAADGDAITKNNAEAAEATVAAEAQDKDEEILAFTQERKITEKHEKERIREISKNIKNVHQRKKEDEARKIHRILEEFKGTKNISNIQTAKKRIFIPKITNKKGETINTRDGIANVFAEFCENLYDGEEGEEDKNEQKAKSRTEDKKRMLDQFNTISEITKSEIQDAIDRLKRGKAKDSSGVRAEQLKNCSDRTKETLRKIFNEIIRREDFAPRSWRKIRIQVIYKKGDREDAGNYRPICSLPVLYKLFATVLNARLAPPLHKIQPLDLGVFRPNHRTEDHRMVYKILEQRCHAWSVPLYISTIDFTKAFDRIKQKALWSSLQHYGVEPICVRLLPRLYSHHQRTVLTNKECDIFPIKRGTTHCPPYSLTQCCN